MLRATSVLRPLGGKVGIEPPVIPRFLPREEKNASPREMPFSLTLPQQVLLTLPP